jgi:hypothetical protein
MEDLVQTSSEKLKFRSGLGFMLLSEAFSTTFAVMFKFDHGLLSRY